MEPLHALVQFPSLFVSPRSPGGREREREREGEGERSSSWSHMGRAPRSLPRSLVTPLLPYPLSFTPYPPSLSLTPSPPLLIFYPPSDTPRPIPDASWPSSRELIASYPLPRPSPSLLFLPAHYLGSHPPVPIISRASSSPSAITCSIARFHTLACMYVISGGRGFPVSTAKNLSPSPSLALACSTSPG